MDYISQLFFSHFEISDKNNLEEKKFILVPCSQGSVHGQLTPQLWVKGEAGHMVERHGGGTALAGHTPSDPPSLAISHLPMVTTQSVHSN